MDEPIDGAINEEDEAGVKNVEGFTRLAALLLLIPLSEFSRKGIIGFGKFIGADGNS